MQVSFAPLEGDTVDAVLPLMSDFCNALGLRFEPFERRRAINELMANPDLGRVWLVSGDGEAVGYLVMSYGFNMEAGGREGMIDELFIKPGRRGVGIATRALRFVEARARAEGLHALYLEVPRDDPKTQRLYRRLGYRVRDDHCLATLALDP